MSESFRIAALGLIACASLLKGEVVMSFVPVGDAGNAADSTTGFGAVGYDFEISAYEVTQSQYAEFLNAVAATDPYDLYNPSMASVANVAGIARSGSTGSYSYSVIGSGARPVTYVSWFDAARFTNWFHNGQGNSSTETGVYALVGATSGVGFAASATAEVWIPTEDEWYKAAYYDPSKGAASDADNYWLFPTRSDTVPGNDPGGSSPNQANFLDASGFSVTGSSDYDSGQNYLTEVGDFTSSGSYYGTFDQGGNVWEWTDGVLDSSRKLRGAAWNFNWFDLRSSNFATGTPSVETIDFGFRLAGVSLAGVPEPGASLLVALGLGGLLVRRTRGGVG